MSAKPLPFFFIGKDRTEERKKLFIDGKHPVLTSRLGRPETMSIWYSRAHIEKLLEEVDHAGGDGLRLSFGVYEDGHEFAGQLCLVMNVTRMGKIVVLEDEADYSERSRSEKSFNPDTPVTPKDFNFGSPCPPRCDNAN